MKSKLWKLPLILLLTGKQLPAVSSLKNLTQQTEQDRADSARWCLVTSLCPNFLFCSFFFKLTVTLLPRPTKCWDYRYTPFYPICGSPH